ncbi:hypothetical protein [Streptomyces sp. NPDC056672]|uniref:hypothetical protein n=1 Tax=Streptomyces sp. NPDC056672 TaxID=3345906 RepID=UPI0036BF58A8
MIICRFFGVLAGTLVLLAPGQASALAHVPLQGSGPLRMPVHEPFRGPLHEPLQELSHQPPHEPLYGSLQGQLADTGGAAERLWLLGGVALALTGAGVVALAATRGRR